MSAKKGVDYLTPGSDAALRRKAVFLHNAKFGHVRRMIVATQDIMRSPTVTLQGKRLAAKINADAHQLYEILKLRVDG